MADRVKFPHQLGVATSPDTEVPAYITELNKRFGIARHGAKLVIVDFETPSASTGGGIHKSMSYLDVAAFRMMFRGKFAPQDNPKDRPIPQAEAWLSHEMRRKYEAVVYAPGQELPPYVLNLWQGFAVVAKAGDVSVWLELLVELVPDETIRRYVLCWLAWKIQNPGGVPDTLLIFKGNKGTGKNSLFEPIVILFGRHAMLADDPELIAGRFTWHLMSLSLAVLDEAIFAGDPKQADRIKSRVTAKGMMYEQKGMDPVQGINRCAYVMLTNHEHVWQATIDERRAVVIEVGDGLRGNLTFWTRYHAWVNGDGPAALLHYLQGVDLTGFNPRAIPKGEALRKQIEQTALKNPLVAWWYGCLCDGAVRWRDNGDRVANLLDDTTTEIDRAALRLSFEQCPQVRGRSFGAGDWSVASKSLKLWAGPDGIQTTYRRMDGSRSRVDVLPPLQELRRCFTEVTKVQFPD